MMEEIGHPNFHFHGKNVIFIFFYLAMKLVCTKREMCMEALIEIGVHLIIIIVIIIIILLLSSASFDFY